MIYRLLGVEFSNLIQSAFQTQVFNIIVLVTVILKVMVCLGETPNSILTEMRLAKIVNFVVNYKGQRKREIDKDLDSLRDADTRILEVMNHVSPGIVIWMWCQSLSGYQKLKKHGFLMKTVSKLFKDMHFTTLELERLRIDEEKRTEGEVLTGWWQ